MRRYGILAVALLLIPAFAIAGGAPGQQNAPEEVKYTLLTDGEIVGVLTLPKGQGGRVIIQGRKYRINNKHFWITGDVSIKVQRGDKTVLTLTADQMMVEKPAKEPMPEVETTP